MASRFSFHTAYREQLGDVDDRHKLVRLALAASLAISIAFLTLQVVLVVWP